jgi:hypothetical protein
MSTNWTYIETRIPAENQECEITSPEIRGTRKAIFILNAPIQHWRMTDCIHPVQNCYVSAHKSAWRISITPAHDSGMSEKREISAQTHPTP